MLIRTSEPLKLENNLAIEEAIDKMNLESDKLVNEALEDIGYSKDFVCRNYQNFRSILQDVNYIRDCEISTITIEYKGEPVLLFRRIIDLSQGKLLYNWENLLPGGVLIL